MTYNRSEIMKQAHESVRFLRRSGFRESYAELLAGRLAHAWACAKEQAAKAAMSTKALRVVSIKEEISQLESKSFRINIAARRTELQTELALAA